jgi:two-component system chemotaxis response regulator CheY
VIDTLLISNNVELNPFTSNASEQGEMNILVVDDDPRVVETVRVVLKRMGGYKILEAQSASECLRQIKENQPALVLLDTHMPHMDGLDVLRQIRSEVGGKDLPVLMISVDAQFEQMAACFKAGANGFLIKPFDTANLYRQVRNAIAQRGVNLLHADSAK